MDEKLIHISKFLSFVLRHKPDEIGIMLDSEGWTDVDELIEAANRSGIVLDRALLRDVVETNDKRRFALSAEGERIRAVQGHSSPAVKLQYIERTPPASLFHGTSTRFLESIQAEGLKPGSRHFVHLSRDPETAKSVGMRHGKPAVLKIDAEAMHRSGHKFFQAENGVWLAAEIPTSFIMLAF